MYVCTFAISQNEESALLSAMSVLVFGLFMGYQFEQKGIQEGLKNYKSYKPQITGTYENGKFVATDTTFIKVKK